MNHISLKKKPNYIKNTMIALVLYVAFDLTRAIHGIEMTAPEQFGVLIVGNVLAVALWWVLPCYLIYKTFCKFKSFVVARS